MPDIFMCLHKSYTKAARLIFGLWGSKIDQRKFNAEKPPAPRSPHLSTTNIWYLVRSGSFVLTWSHNSPSKFQRAAVPCIRNCICSQNMALLPDDGLSSDSNLEYFWQYHIQVPHFPTSWPWLCCFCTTFDVLNGGTRVLNVWSVRNSSCL